jgi:hypothetical protein
MSGFKLGQVEELSDYEKEVIKANKKEEAEVVKESKVSKKTEKGS